MSSNFCVSCGAEIPEGDHLCPNCKRGDAKLHVYIKDPGRPPRSVNISTSLRNLQKTVGGYIETLTFEPGWCIICNEEGRLMDLPYNCEIMGVDLVGPIIFIGVDGDQFTNVPFTFQELREEFPELWEV